MKIGLSLSALALVLFTGISYAAAAPEGEITTQVPQAAAENPFKPSALMQVWALNDNSTTSNPQLNFRLRRVELKATGSVVENTRYFVMVDAAKAINANGDNKILQDLGVAFTILPGLELTGGQFKTLTSAEGLGSSAELLFPEKSLVGRTYGDRREPGFMITYENSGWKLGAMASNGSGSNADSTKDTKDLSIRLDKVISPQWKVGAFTLLGDLTFDRKGWAGANVRYTPFENATFGVEAATGRTAGINSYGVMADAGYAITPTLQPVFRYEIYKPNTDSGIVAEQISVGLNYYVFKQKAKIQTALSYLHNMAGGVAGSRGTPIFTKGSYGSLATVDFQMAI